MARPSPRPPAERRSRVGLHERLEDAPELVARDAAAVVAHGDAHASGLERHVDVDDSARGRELCRVREQVARRLG